MPTPEEEKAIEEAWGKVEQAGYKGTKLEPYITLIRRQSRKTGAITYNPYMTVDGRLMELKGEEKAFSVRTYVNTGDSDVQLIFGGDTILVPMRSCLAIFTDSEGAVHFGTASIGTGGMVDQTNPIENAETSAVGRALGMAGYGLMPGTAGIASAEEVIEAMGREGDDDWKSWSLEKLGGFVMPAPWGKDRKFASMTLAQIYADDDGFGAMQWASGLTETRGVTAMMAHYFKLMSIKHQLDAAEGQDFPTEQELLAEEEIPFDRASDENEMVVIAGKNVRANGQLSGPWAKWLTNKIRENTGEGKVFSHPNHVTNHLKSHFRVAKVIDLTGKQAKALVEYIDSDGEIRDPEYYQDADGDTEDLFGPETLGDLLSKAAPNLPEQFASDPQGWFKAVCEEFGIGPDLSNKQISSLSAILKLIASGVINLREIGDSKNDPMFTTFVESMKKTAANGKD